MFRFFFFSFSVVIRCFFFFFFNDTATTEIYTLSLHDALPISRPRRGSRAARPRPGPSSPSFRFRWRDRKSTRLNSSHLVISYAVFCLKKKKNSKKQTSTIRQLRRRAAYCVNCTVDVLALYPYD